MNWDRERLTEIIMQLEEDARLPHIVPEKFDEHVINELEELVASARSEAIGWCWAEACSQYSKGLNPGDQNIPELHAKALLDLNPERK